ncbi:hypothetical protein [Nocardioides sp. 503]|uniref:hypothetical protein n=1 Tax=Nocardioides sp. 503 TaxID=2508326 RepID=UPI00106F2244|nr:hypothetical protein [Nocardioides sp. 503]
MMRQRRILDGLLAGIAGVLLTLAVVGIVHVAHRVDAGPPQPFTVFGVCAGSEVAVTLAQAPGSSLVLVDVVIHDVPLHQRGQVTWAGYPGRAERISPELDTNVAQVFRQLGDLDDGPQRRVWIRPDGQRAWCKTVARLA